MKKFVLGMFVFGLTLASCSSDDEPTPVNEEELITTVAVTLTGGGQTITLTYRDLDGDGGNAPVYIPALGTLKKNVTYSGSIAFLNESVSPAEDITEEVEEEGTAHQVFYQLGSSLGSLAYASGNNDSNGKPIGTEFSLTTIGTGTGNLVVTLKHEPNKSASGLNIQTPNLAGGSTDAYVSFPVVVVE